VYGSFRFGVRFADVKGTCGAGFWYRDDSSEVDVEYLSRTDNGSSQGLGAVNFVLQSPQSEAAGFDAAGTPGFGNVTLPFVPGGGYHEYRFDWLPGVVTFFADGQEMWTVTENVPDGPGRVILNHWSNGDENWSGGPPAADAVMVVSYVKAYFNSSNVTRTAQWEGACGGNGQGASTKTCSIPGWSGSIDPTGPDGNDTGRTFFFSTAGGEEVVNQTIYPGTTAVPGRGSRRSEIPVLYLGWSGAVVLITVVLSVLGFAIV